MYPCPCRLQADRVTRRFTVGDDPDGAPPPGTLYDIRHYKNWSRGTKPYQYALRICGWCPDGAGMAIVLVRSSGAWRSDFCSMHSETIWKRRITLDDVTPAARETLDMLIAEPPQLGPRRVPRHPERAFRDGFPTFAAELDPSPLYELHPSLRFDTVDGLVHSVMDPALERCDVAPLADPSWLIPWIGDGWNPGACVVPFLAELAINRYLRSVGVAGTARTAAAHVLPPHVLATIVHGTGLSPYWPTLAASQNCIPWLPVRPAPSNQPQNEP